MLRKTLKDKSLCFTLDKEHVQHLLDCDDDDEKPKDVISKGTMDLKDYTLLMCQVLGK